MSQEAGAALGTQVLPKCQTVSLNDCPKKRSGPRFLPKWWDQFLHNFGSIGRTPEPPRSPVALEQHGFSSSLQPDAHQKSIPVEAPRHLFFLAVGQSHPGLYLRVQTNLSNLLNANRLGLYFGSDYKALHLKLIKL